MSFSEITAADRENISPIYVYNGDGASAPFVSELEKSLRENIDPNIHSIEPVNGNQIDLIEESDKKHYYFIIPGGNAYQMYLSMNPKKKSVIENALGIIGFCAGAVLLHSSFKGFKIVESKELPCCALGFDFIRGTCNNPPYKIYSSLEKNIRASLISCSNEAVAEMAAKTNNLYVLWAGGPKLPESDDGLEVIARYEKDPDNRVAAIVQKGKFIASAVHPEFMAKNAVQYGFFLTGSKLQEVSKKLTEDELKQRELFRFLLRRIGIELLS